MADQVQTTGLPETAAPSAAYVAQMTSAQHTDPTPAHLAAAPSAAPTVPEKFRAADGSLDSAKLLASYAELEKKLSGGTAQDAPNAAPAAAPKADEPPAQEAKPGAKIERPADPQAAQPSPLTTAIETLKTAYEGGQELTDDLIKPLTEAGLPRDVVETYFAGLRAIEASIELTAHQVAGGKDAFEAARNWAASALSDQELDYYNTQAANPATAKQAVEWLMAKHSAANPSEGRLVDAQPVGSAVAGDVFNSQHEVTKAMASAEYKANPAFRQQVAEKLQRSIRAGTLRSTVEYHRQG
ncbi:MAG: capsid assembly protein [Phenylobacterium sp.]|uniref:capsid assembly protein n=1 Tax=Phenylobacterium sp. TaxID=1871053 RepID=UPI00391B43BD